MIAKHNHAVQQNTSTTVSHNTSYTVSSTTGKLNSTYETGATTKQLKKEVEPECESLVSLFITTPEILLSDIDVVRLS